MTVLGVFGVLASCLAVAASSPIKLTLSKSLNELMTEIRFEEREPEQPVSISRILILGDRVRMDYGQDEAGFILFDGRAHVVWHVSPSDRRLTGVVAGMVGKVWAQDWNLSQEQAPSEQGVLVQVRLNGMFCSEFKAAPMLHSEARLLGDFRRLLAANQAKAWLETPEEKRQPCALALDVQAAGVEYSHGFPLAIRYWDGRSRVYQSHAYLRARPALFELPAGYARVVVSGVDQGNARSRQPSASQER